MKKQNKFISWIKSPASDFWLFVAVLVLANLVASRALGFVNERCVAK